jgi:hypothetical protein
MVDVYRYLDNIDVGRQEDLKARDEFHQRMIKKDKDKQRNIVVKVRTHQR